MMLMFIFFSYHQFLVDLNSFFDNYIDKILVRIMSIGLHVLSITLI
jgi:hypothetical protein